MKHKTIGQLASIARVSIRTLHHYDAIDLLKSSVRADNGYRYYNDFDEQRLHDILFFRALGFSLQEIKQLLELSNDDRRQLLLTQREQLDKQLHRLQGMRIRLEEILTNQEELTMSTENKFAVFEGFDPDQHAQEVEQRWGNSDAYKQSSKRTQSYSKQDWQKYKSESEQLSQRMATLMDDGMEPGSEQVLEVIELMRLQIDQWFYDCSREMHANLGEMYVNDERFNTTYEKVRPNMASFVRDAARANLNRGA